jgi:hypothetical protein
MPTRHLRIVRYTFPLTAICECCNQTFKSRELGAKSATYQVRRLFEVHTCKLLEGSQNAVRVVPEATEKKIA